MRILGLSGSSHDSAACIVEEGRVISAIEEERISRVKHARNTLPVEAARASIAAAGMRSSDVDAVAFFFDPDEFNKRVVGHVVRQWRRYIAQPRAYRTLRFLRRGERYRKEAETVVRALGIKAPVSWIRHHDAHAATAFFCSGFARAAVLSVDNIGELDSTQLGVGEGLEYHTLSSQSAPHSLGMLYAGVTDYLGFRPWDEEGKVMALAAYGETTTDVSDILRCANGMFELTSAFQMVETPTHDRCFSPALVCRYGPPRSPRDAIKKRHKDLAASVQQAVEQALAHLVRWLHDKTGLRHVCVAGGVGLNCKANGTLLSLPCVDRLFVFPAAGDAGAAVGAALSLSAAHGVPPVALRHADLGRSFGANELAEAAQASGLRWHTVDDPASTAADLLMHEPVIAWFQGRSEFGPRALGHRSLLARPDQPGIRDHINRHVKQREMWRPLCPSLLGQEAARHFARTRDSLFMNIAHRTTDSLETELPDVFHCDGTARIQVVDGGSRTAFSRLLSEVRARTGRGILLNTSFNLPGCPLVDSPSDAVAAARQMNINSLVLGQYVLQKE